MKKNILFWGLLFLFNSVFALDYEALDNTINEKVIVKIYTGKERNQYFCGKEERPKILFI